MGFTYFYVMTKSNCSDFRNLGWYRCDDLPVWYFLSPNVMKLRVQLSLA